MQITIAGAVVPVEQGTTRIVRAIGQRSQGSFRLYDAAGTLRFYEAQPVVITDNYGNTAFTGVVAQAQRARPVQGPLLEHVITVADNHYYADKRLAPGSWANVTAATIFNDILTNVLAQEGITSLAYRANVLADTPLTYYRLGDAVGSGTAADSSGNGRTGTVNGGVTFGEAGLLAGDTDTAALFDGSTGYVALPTTGLPTGAQPWTLEAWISASSFGGGGARGTILGFGTYANDSMATLQVYNNGTSTQLVLSCYSADIAATAALSLNTTYHVVGTYDGVSTRLYVNGALAASGTFALTIANAFANIGAGNSPATDLFAGIVDEAAIYTYALSADRIAAHYQMGLSTPIQTGPTIVSLISDYAPCSDVFDAITQKAGGGWYWTIDNNKVLWFQQQTSAPVAPYTIDDTLTERGTDVATHGNTQYRNTQYMLGGVQPTAQQTETRQGDGKTTAFLMGYPLNSVPTITLNGAAQTVGITGVESGKQWYWQSGSNVITQDSSGTKLVSTDTLQVVYVGQYPAVAISSDNGAITTRAAREGSGGSGIVEAVAYDTTLTSTTQAQQGAAGYLSKYAHDLDTLVCLTKTYGFAEGQACVVNVPAHNFINESMLIESVTITDRGPIGGEVVDLYYDLKCVSGPINMGWQAWYKALASQAAQVIGAITLGQSQTVALLQSGTVAWSWTVTGSATVNSLLIPQTTLYPSTTLYPGTAGTPVSLTWTKPNVALNALRDILSGAGSSLDTTYFAWGTGTQATPATATQLAAEAGRKAVTSITNGASVGEELINGYLGPQDAVGVAITEVAFFAGPNASSGANTGVMLLYALYSHTHTASESLQIQADSTFA